MPVEAIVVHAHKLAYVPTPKCANTSIKHLLHRLEHGRAYVGAVVDGKQVNIHDHYREQQVELSRVPEDYFRFAVVRDPIKRLLSAYSNRVVHYRELREELLLDVEGDVSKLDADPSLAKFVRHLAAYREASSPIAVHTAYQRERLGWDLGAFTRVYRFEELNELTVDLSARVGRPLSLPVRQTGGPKIAVSDLPLSSLLELLLFYRLDYRFLSAYYSMDAILRDWLNGRIAMLNAA